MPRSLRVVVVLVLLLAGCADRCYYSRDEVQKDTISGLRLEIDVVSGASGIRVGLQKSYSADVVHKDFYSQGNLITILAAASVELATLGAVDANREEVSAPQSRTMNEPLKDGTAVTGRLRILDADGGRQLLLRAVSYNIRDSSFTIDVPRELPCCRVVFDGTARVMGEDLAVIIDEIWER